ncbi:P-loop containing nucleoside triphosphate hydrolase protein [Melanogaster broomeanus]|nr:P-loop containing nucleoside triphosphate hydrolase protein [Melanogaster broomeanus]
MPRRARIHFVSLKSSLVNLPISIYGPLLERSIRPQTLAVHLKSESRNTSKVEAYVGWTGMASSSSLAHFNSADGREKGIETIEIDPQYSQGLGFAEGDIVEIGLLHDLPYASSVGTEPVTSDDWEIIEIHASHVESTLLSQVRVAKLGQEIDVWVLGRTRVRLTVVSLEPSTKGNAALLTTDTEVSIAPKAHSRQRAAAPAKSTASEDNILKQPSKPSFPEDVLRVLPIRLVDAIPPAATSYSRPETLAYIHPYTFSLLAGSRYPLKDHMKGVFLKLSYRVLQPPQNPLDAPRNGDAAAEPPEPTPQVLHPGGKSEVSPADKTAKVSTENVLFVGWSDKVLESHVFFPNGLEGIGDWHWIHVTFTGEQETVSGLFSDTTAVAQLGGPEPPKPSPPEAILSGVENIIKEGTNQLVANFAVHSLDRVVRGSAQGVGKTSVAREIAKRLEEDTRTYAYIHYIDFRAYSEKPVATLKALFRYLYEIAAWHRPTVLVFDNLDKVLKAGSRSHANSFRSRHITELFIAQYSSGERMIPSNFRGIVMIGTAESQTSLHSLVHTLHIFQEVYHIQSPNKDARKEILANLVQQRNAKSPGVVIDPDDPPNYAMIATHTEGYSPIDLQVLVTRAAQQSANKAFQKHGASASQITLSAADFSDAQVDFIPNSLRDVPLQKSNVEWADVGGLKQAKRIVRETLEWPAKYAPLFKQSPLRLRSGLMLYGYPGCGKTLLASAVAKECGLNFISVKGPELLNKYIGASEKSVRDIFDRASSAKPCVLFFDEFDSIAPKRGHDSTGVTDRVVNQLLTQMDGAEGLTGVYVLAATSRPDLIDAALLRPGRLDKSILCDMPDEEDRRDILKAVSRKVTLGSSVDLDEIARLTAGYSGADLQALVYNAHLQVVHASIDAMPTTSRSAQLDEEKRIEYVVLGGTGENKTLSRAEESVVQKRLQQIMTSTNAKPGADMKTAAPPKEYEITQDDLLQVLKTTRPSVSREELDRLGRIYSSFVSDRSHDKKVFPSTPGPSGVGTRATLG